MKYQVKAGDTLSSIAWRCNVSTEEMARLNGLSDIHRLRVGQQLKIPSERPLPRKKAEAVATRPFRPGASSPRAPRALASASGPTTRGLFEQGKEVGCFGRVRSDEGVNLRETPSGAIVKKLPFNTRVFVSHELPGDWYFVMLDDRSFGYVACPYVSIHPPEPAAFLYKIKKGEGALRIVKQHYKSNAISWGQDERYYANVLVEANRSQEPSGIYKPFEGADWSQTRTRENYLIWIPSPAFARSLRFRVPSGSISYEAWQAALRTAVAVGDFVLASSAFAAGLIHGALESVWDLVTGIMDLVTLVWDILKSVFTLELFSDLKALWDWVTSLKASELIAAGLESFLARWNDPDLLRRWHFRGWVVGYAIAEIVMALITASATLVKWAGKAGTMSKLVNKFPKLLKAAEKVTTASKRVPDEALQRIKRAVSRSPDEAPSGTRRHVPWSGARYIENADLEDIQAYEKIIESAKDFSRMSRFTDVPIRMLERVYDHLFIKIHEVPIGPNTLVKGHFTPDGDIARLWRKATDGSITTDEKKRFKRLMAHEYVESRLMEEGNLPYRSAHPDAWSDGMNWPSAKQHGAHDLAPHCSVDREPLDHWKKLGLEAPTLKSLTRKSLNDGAPVNLVELDELVQHILKMRRN